MPELKDFIKEFRESRKWSKSAIAKKIGISSQRYGKYEAGIMKPKSDFYEGWEKAFGEDLAKVLKQKNEPNVSRGAEKPTSVHKTTDNNEMGEMKINLDEYSVVPKVVLQDSQLVSKSEIDRTEAKVQQIIDTKNELISELKEQIKELRAVISTAMPSK